MTATREVACVEIRHAAMRMSQLAELQVLNGGSKLLLLSSRRCYRGPALLLEYRGDIIPRNFT